MTGAVRGRVDFGGIRFGFVAGSADVVDELVPFGFVPTPDEPEAPFVDPGTDLVRGPTFVIGRVGDGYRTRVVEPDELGELGEVEDREDGCGPDSETAATFTEREPPRRYGAPVPHGGSFATVSGAVHGALSVMTERVVRIEPNWLHLHAGAVVVAGVGVVIPAESGVGKTTLVAELGRLGGVVTDELVAIDRRAGVIRGPKRPLSVKSTGFQRAAETYPMLSAQRPGEFVWHISLDSIGLDHVPAVSPRLVMIPDRRPGTVEITEIDPGEALLALIAHSYDLDVDPERAFDDLVWLVSSCHCVRAGYEDAAEVADRLEVWLDRHRLAPEVAAVRVDLPEGGVLAVRLGEGEVRWNKESRDVVWLDVSGQG